ncbi:MAG: hypothetical protein HYY31_06515 [Chloroflexi bacterium]|nr:hypothetical protein [Chloroflexota bacterium]
MSAPEVPHEKLAPQAKAVSNWLLGEMARLLAASRKELEKYPSELRTAWAKGVHQLISLVDEGVISSTQAKSVFEEMFHSGKEPRSIVEEKGLSQVSDVASVLAVIEQALAENSQAVGDYVKGKETALRFLVGQVMKLSRGKANPAVINTLLKERLDALR